MTKNTLLAGVAALSMALASTASFAQSQPTSPEQRAAVPNNSSIEMNADTVPRDRPFGEMDMSSAGTDETSWRAFWNGLNTEQQSEMRARCEYITSNPTNFQEVDVEQCGVYAGNAESMGTTTN